MEVNGLIDHKLEAENATAEDTENFAPRQSSISLPPSQSILAGFLGSR